MANTANRNYPKPVSTNDISDDVSLLQSALDLVDGDVDGLLTALSGKANTSHSHAIVGISGLQSALDDKSATSHTHALDNLTDVSGAGGAAAGMLLQKGVSGWNPVSVAAAVGDVVEDLVDAGFEETQNASNLTSGTVDLDRLDEHVMPRQSVISGGTDFNTVTDAGWHPNLLRGGTGYGANQPPSFNGMYWHLEVIKYGATVITQIAHPYGYYVANSPFSGAGPVFRRASADGGTTWSAWIPIASDASGIVGHLGGISTGARTEYGISGNNWFERFDCGRQICGNLITGLGPISTAEGGLFRTSALIYPGGFAASFVAPPSVHYSSGRSGNWADVQQIYNGSTISWPGGVLTRGSTHGSVDYRLDCFAEGRWR